MNEATTAAYAGVKILEAMTRQNEALFNGIIATLDALNRLESHVERVEQRLGAIEARTVSEAPK